MCFCAIFAVLLRQLDGDFGADFAMNPPRTQPPAQCWRARMRLSHLGEEILRKILHMWNNSALHKVESSVRNFDEAGIDDLSREENT